MPKIREPYREPILRRLADAGDPHAALELFRDLRAGRGVRSTGGFRTLQRFRRALVSYIPAQIEVAELESPGGLGLSFSARSDRWWRRVAAAGRAEGFAGMALRHLPHHGDPAKRRAARRLLLRAARGGDGEAAFDLAMRVETLAGDLRVVARWLEFARNRWCASPADEMLLLVRRAKPFLRRFRRRTVGAWRIAARSGDLDAAVHLAYAKRFGRGVAYDPAGAIRVFEAASRRGSIEAAIVVALHHDDEETRRVRSVPEEAASAIRAAKSGDPVGRWLAATVAWGRGVTARRGLVWLADAARAGVVEAADELAFRHEVGHGAPVSRRQATRWARVGARAGHVRSANRLADRLRHGPSGSGADREVVRLLRSGAAADALDASTNLGVRLHEGRGVRRDDSEAVRRYRRAARLGETSAMANLGRCHRAGHGVPRRPKAAARWFRLAADVHEQPASAFVLGRMYERGELGRRDDREAVRWFARGAAMGDPEGLSELGVHYHAGRGVPRDRAFAALLYRAAAELGDGWGAFCLGLCHRDGEGASRNRASARRWFRVAVARGVRKARAELERLEARPLREVRPSARTSSRTCTWS